MFVRWFDKSLSLILTGSGNACVNFEHAWGDGVAVLRYFNEVFANSIDKSVVHPSTDVPTNAGNVRKLGELSTQIILEVKVSVCIWNVRDFDLKCVFFLSNVSKKLLGIHNSQKHPRIKITHPYVWKLWKFCCLEECKLGFLDFVSQWNGFELKYLSGDYLKSLLLTDHFLQTEVRLNK